MSMSFDKALLISIIGMSFGIFLGLLFRPIRYDVKIRNLWPTFVISLKYLIFYPICFPVLVIKNKKNVIEFLFQKSLTEIKTKSQLDEIELKKKIAREINFSFIVKQWIKLLIYIVKEFDSYTASNIRNAAHFIVKQNQVLSVSKTYYKEMNVRGRNEKYFEFLSLLAKQLKRDKLYMEIFN